jgi:hypothetical protein
MNEQTCFGQLTNGATVAENATWHVLRWSDDGGWRTLCTAMTARPNLRVVNISDKPGDRVCRLVRCQRMFATWADQTAGTLEAPPA